MPRGDNPHPPTTFGAPCSETKKFRTEDSSLESSSLPGALVRVHGDGYARGSSDGRSVETQVRPLSSAVVPESAPRNGEGLPAIEYRDQSPGGSVLFMRTDEHRVHVP